MGARHSKSESEEGGLVQDQQDDYGSFNLQSRRKFSTSSSTTTDSSSSSGDDPTGDVGCDVELVAEIDEGDVIVADDERVVVDEPIVTFSYVAEVESAKERRSTRSMGGPSQEGDINFRGITRETKAKFMVLSDATRGREAWQAMEKKWNIKKPSIILSVIGGARPFYLDDRIAASFRATILKASQLDDACIITGGAYSGVMKMVGDALQETMSAFCLGISTWNDIMNREVIMKNTDDYVVGSYLSQRGLYLDYQHTNFVIGRSTLH